MFNTLKSDLWATGLAIFAMFFGAGNIIFPLALGQETMQQTPFALAGLIATAVLIPFSGLLAMFLYKGHIRAFFGRLGPYAGMALAFFIIALLGPLGSTPRCIALSYSTLSLSYPGISLPLFNAIACVCLFLLAYKKQRLLGILGYVLTPFLLALLAFIVIKGLMSPPDTIPEAAHLEASTAFWKGFKEGYNMMDLLAAFFFAPVIIGLTKDKMHGLTDEKSRFLFVLKASAIGAVLLSLVYIGFSLLSSWHAADLHGTPSDQLLGIIALKMTGPYAGLVVSLTVVLACLTTAVALIAAFAGFMHQEIFGKRISYPVILGASVLVTYCVASFEFQGISKFLSPVLEICYPALILLTAYNLIESLYRIRVKTKETPLI